MSALTAGIETRVDGSPDSVDAAATWLRTSLASGLRGAGDQLAAARAAALAGFHGQAGSSYERLDARLLRLVDEHAARVERAAGALTAYAARLRALQQLMASCRDRATAGGLTVAGTLILEPPVRVLGATGDPAELYDQLAREVPAEHLRFVAWAAEHLAAAARDVETDDVAQWAQLVRRHFDGLGRSVGQKLAEHTVEEIARSLQDRADDLERARGTGEPPRRAPGPVPLDEADRLRGLSRLADATGRALGPAGTAVDGLGALEGDKPAGGLLAVGVGTGLALATAPVTVPTVGTVVVGAAVAYFGSEGTKWGWDRLPDSFTDPADEWVEDQWEDTKDEAGEAWKSVKGWF
ncbi:hypothetical protein [Nocardioides pantholopis]|uniref:hypothetical protein n=1 Tax=Nocardioides pantholopis TaxID=2483798 RepID=UPI000FD898D5|nr:hypothetical protein [Nocardioides pantholopis]